MLRFRSIGTLLTGALLLAGVTAFRPGHAPLPPMKVIKSPSCGCCAKWVEYMKKSGFQVTVENKEEFTDIKRSNGVTAKLESCHTALVGGYVIEGHVPEDLVKKLLAEKPVGIKGLAAPGMPPSSPGMDMPGNAHYVIYSFDAKGNAKPYAER